MSETIEAATSTYGMLMNGNPASAQLTDAEQIRRFTYAGDAYFTVVSKKTGERRTFRVRLAPNPKAEGPWFVSMLTGPDNTSNYRYLGCCWRRTGSQRDQMAAAASTHYVFKPQAKPGAEDAKRNAAWVLNAIQQGFLSEAAEFWHAGRCGCCGRLLTDPESIKRGIGPVCAEKGGW